MPRELQTQEELVPLVIAAQQGDAAAMEELAWRVQPLIRNLSMKYGVSGAKTTDRVAAGHGRYSGEQLEEIIQEAWYGFVDAVERYDPEHPKAKSFWTVVGYRVKEAIQQWQSKNSGGIGMPRRAWQTAWNIDEELEAARVTEWEKLTDAELKEVTGVHSAGPILRARTPGHTLFEDDEEYQRRTPSAEDDYLNLNEHFRNMQLLGWLEGLRDIPEEHWEAATYWLLEHLGLAGELEAQDVVDRWRQYESSN